MQSSDQSVDRFRGKLATLLAVRSAASWLTGWAFLWGTAVLVLRATSHIPRELLLWGLAGIPLALVPALLLTRCQIPSRSAVRALLDRHNALGGMLMAGAELPLGRWDDTLPEPALPRVHWRGAKTLTLLAAATAYLLLGFLLPQRFILPASDPPLDIRREVVRLSGQIEVLKEEKLLEPARAEDLQKRLTQLSEEASGREPAKTLEALDRVADTTSKKAKEAAEAALRKTEQLTAAESLAATLRRKKRKGEPALQDKTRKQAMEELARLTRKAAEENERLKKALDQETLKSMEDALDPEQQAVLEKLAEALRDAKGDLSRMMGKLHKARLIDADKLKDLERCGECDGEALEAFLKANEGKGTMRELVARFRLSLPGKGGVDRGPGPADLTFGKPTEETKHDFKEQALPPGTVADLKQSRLQGVSPSAPKVEPGGTVSSGALAAASSGSGSANTQVVLPRHKAAVERYFERPPRSPK